MKITKIFIVLLATMISGSMAGQTITASDVTIERGQTAEVTFSINSETKAALAEFKMMLPEGVSVKYDAEQEDYVYELGSSMTLKTHSVTVKRQESGLYYVLVSNSSKREFKAASGDYLTLTLEASENAVSGKALIQNILLVDINAEQMNTVTAGSFSIVVPNAFLKGDANADGVVDVADVVAIANYVLDRPASNFNNGAADVNGDGSIDVVDATTVIDIILGLGNTSAARMRSILEENGFIF